MTTNGWIKKFVYPVFLTLSQHPSVSSTIDASTVINAEVADALEHIEASFCGERNMIVTTQIRMTTQLDATRRRGILMLD